MGDDTIKPHQLAAFDVLRIGKGVSVADIGAVDAVQDHVHLADRPSPSVGILAAKVEVERIAAVLLHVVRRLHQDTTGAQSWIDDARADIRLYLYVTSLAAHNT